MVAVNWRQDKCHKLIPDKSNIVKKRYLPTLQIDTTLFQININWNKICLKVSQNYQNSFCMPNEEIIWLDVLLCTSKYYDGALGPNKKN